MANGINLDLSQKASIQPFDINQINTYSRVGGSCFDLVLTDETYENCSAGHNVSSCTTQCCGSCYGYIFQWEEVPCPGSGGGITGGNTGSGNTGTGTGVSSPVNQPGNGNIAPSAFMYPDGTSAAPAVLINVLGGQSQLTTNQLNWIGDFRNYAAVNMLLSYLSQNGYSTEAQELVKLSIDGFISYNVFNYPGMNLGYSYQWWLDENFIKENFNFGFDVGGGFDNLTAEEKILVALFPAQAIIIRENKNPAETETISRFGNNGRNDKSDAFRHAFFNAMNTNDVGDIVARLFSNAHESETPTNLILEKQMDLFNNNIGHSIGSNASIFISDQELSNLVYQSLIWGSLRYLSPLTVVMPPNYGITSSTQLIPTNQ